jgi:ubiquinone/menaquinone biosynthesis C-methylase UbiE
MSIQLSSKWIGRRMFSGVLATGALLFAGVLNGQDSERRVPYVPSPNEVVDEMLKLAGVKAGDVVYDLGCGDGRIVITAVQKYGAARGVGVDIDPQRIKESEENARKAGIANKVKFIQGDLFNADLREASVVTLYLLPDFNLRLRPKLMRELKVGTRIVSHSFDMGDWKADKTVNLDYKTIYLWTVTEQAKAAAAKAAD